MSFSAEEINQISNVIAQKTTTNWKKIPKQTNKQKEQAHTL